MHLQIAGTRGERRSHMDAVTGMERAAIEARARRIAQALLAAHAELDPLEHDALPDPGGARRRTIHEHAFDLATLTALLPRTHGLRLAAEHAARTVDEWAVQPVGTDDARVGSLSMVIAMALLRRALVETDRKLVV